jgi:hypothetical protein
LEQQKQELKYFVTRRITQLIEEQENRLNLFDTRSPNVKDAIELEDSQKIEVSISDIEEVSPLSLRRESQQREVTMSKENKNHNGKRIIETKLTGKKARKIIKKRAKIDRLQKIPEGVSQKENLQNLNFVEISDQQHRPLRRGGEIYPLEADITVRIPLRTGQKELMVHH